MMRLKIGTILGAIGLAIAAPLSAGTALVEASVEEHGDGTRSLHHETVIAAPAARVWDAFSTVDGWKSWGVSFASMDFRAGRTIESGYHQGAVEGDPRNIVHRILAVVPARLLVTRLDRVPEGGPVDPAVMQKLWAVYEIEPVDECHTRLRISGHGYGEGEDFDRLIAFFEQGNVYSIEMMRAAIEGAAQTTK